MAPQPLQKLIASCETLMGFIQRDVLSNQRPEETNRIPPPPQRQSVVIHPDYDAMTTVTFGGKKRTPARFIGWGISMLKRVIVEGIYSVKINDVAYQFPQYTLNDDDPKVVAKAFYNIASFVCCYAKQNKPFDEAGSILFLCSNAIHFAGGLLANPLDPEAVLDALVPGDKAAGKDFLIALKKFLSSLEENKVGVVVPQTMPWSTNAFARAAIGFAGGRFFKQMGLDPAAPLKNNFISIFETMLMPSLEIIDLWVEEENEIKKKALWSTAKYLIKNKINMQIQKKLLSGCGSPEDFEKLKKMDLKQVLIDLSVGLSVPDILKSRTASSSVWEGRDDEKVISDFLKATSLTISDFSALTPALSGKEIQDLMSQLSCVAIQTLLKSGWKAVEIKTFASDHKKEISELGSKIQDEKIIFMLLATRLPLEKLSAFSEKIKLNGSLKQKLLSYVDSEAFTLRPILEILKETGAAAAEIILSRLHPVGILGLLMEGASVKKIKEFAQENGGWFEQKNPIFYALRYQLSSEKADSIIRKIPEEDLVTLLDEDVGVEKLFEIVTQNTFDEMVKKSEAKGKNELSVIRYCLSDKNPTVEKLERYLEKEKPMPSPSAEVLTTAAETSLEAFSPFPAPASTSTPSSIRSSMATTSSEKTEVDQYTAYFFLVEMKNRRETIIKEIDKMIVLRRRNDKFFDSVFSAFKMSVGLEDRCDAAVINLQILERLKNGIDILNKSREIKDSLEDSDDNKIDFNVLLSEIKKTIRKVLENEKIIFLAKEIEVAFALDILNKATEAVIDSMGEEEKELVAAKEELTNKKQRCKEFELDNLIKTYQEAIDRFQVMRDNYIKDRANYLRLVPEVNGLFTEGKISSDRLEKALNAHISSIGEKLSFLGAEMKAVETAAQLYKERVERERVEKDQIEKLHKEKKDLVSDIYQYLDTYLAEREKTFGFLFFNAYDSRRERIVDKIKEGLREYLENNNTGPLTEALREAMTKFKPRGFGRDYKDSLQYHAAHIAAVLKLEDAFPADIKDRYEKAGAVALEKSESPKENIQLACEYLEKYKEKRSHTKLFAGADFFSKDQDKIAREQVVDELLLAISEYEADKDNIQKRASLVKKLETVLEETYPGGKYTPRKIGEYKDSLQFHLVETIKALGFNELIAKLPEGVKRHCERTERKYPQ